MKKVAITIALLAAAVLVAYQIYYADPNIVNESYLNSNRFRTLEKNIENEKSRKGDKEKVLRLVVQGMMDETNKYSQRLPYHLDSLALDSVMVPENRLAISEIQSGAKNFEDYKFYGLQVFQADNYKAVLSLTELPGVYRNIEIGLVTARGSEIIDIELIGRFEKNLKEITSSEVRIDTNKNIQVRMNKYRLYPVRQSQKINYGYTISKDGIIEVKNL
ncbi:MAG: hypothetical protein ACNS64_00785 [Candidatus Halalkalibacterium sp. M3_1C_030]